MEDRFGNLEAWTRKHFPHFEAAELRWSGQVMEPVDFMPYSGRDGSVSVYIHSGDSGQGMTNGVAGSLNFIALYRNGQARFGELFDRARSQPNSLTLGEYVKAKAR